MKINKNEPELEENVPNEIKNEDIKSNDSVESEIDVNETNKKKKMKQPAVFDLLPFEEGDEDYAVSVENKRKTLNDAFKKNKLVSRIVMIIEVAFIIAALVLVVQKVQWATILGYSLAGVALVSLVVYYILTKNKFPNATKVYINEVTTLIDRHVFDNPDLKNLKVYPSMKLDSLEVLSDHIYKDVIDNGSRNIVKGTFLEKEFVCSELALYVPGDKKVQRKVCYLGKYLSFTNNFNFEGRYILTFIGDKDKPVDLPTDIDDLEEQIKEDNFIVYGPQGKPYNKALPSKLLTALKRIQFNKLFLNMNVVLWSGHTGVYLSFEDAVVTIPFEKPYNQENVDVFKAAMEEVLKAFKENNK